MVEILVLSGIFPILLTIIKFQLPGGWLKEEEEAPLNIYSIFSTLPFKGWLKVEMECLPFMYGNNYSDHILMQKFKLSLNKYYLFIEINTGKPLCSIKFIFGCYIWNEVKNKKQKKKRERINFAL